MHFRKSKDKSEDFSTTLHGGGETGGGRNTAIYSSSPSYEMPVKCFVLRFLATPNSFQRNSEGKDNEKWGGKGEGGPMALGLSSPPAELSVQKIFGCTRFELSFRGCVVGYTQKRVIFCGKS